MKKTNSSLLNASEKWRRYCLYPDALEYGNKVELLVDGAEAFRAMIEAIKDAKQTILMDSYIFNDDTTGKKFAAAIMSRASAGIETYLVVDAIGTINVPGTFFSKMEHAGVKVLEYRPVFPWRRGWGIFRRNHRKVLVVDGKTGFVGGINIGDEWAPKKNGGLGWHDIHVRIEGPSVRELAKLERATWSVHGNVILDQRRFLPDVNAAGDTFVSIVGSRERRKRKAIRNSYLHAIKRASNYIYIANAYFIPGSGFRRALRNAVKRGVDVRVMVPAKSDITSVQMASQALYGRLMRNGVRLFLWNDAVLHAKTAVIDDSWCTVGSFNIDRRSWEMNLEVNVNVVGEKFALKLRQVFEKDQHSCTELSRKHWRQRPWLQRLTERFFYLFKRLM